MITDLHRSLTSEVYSFEQMSRSSGEVKLSTGGRCVLLYQIFACVGTPVLKESVILTKGC